MDLFQHLDTQRMRTYEQNPETNSRQLQIKEGKIVLGFLEVVEAGNSHTKPRGIQDYRIKKKKKKKVHLQKDLFVLTRFLWF